MTKARSGDLGTWTATRPGHGGVLAQDGSQLGFKIGQQFFGLLGSSDREGAVVHSRHARRNPPHLLQAGKKPASDRLAEAELFLMVAWVVAGSWSAR